MLYINQLDYRHVPYNHNMDNGGAAEDKRNVASSGCGLCSVCMIVDHLTTKHLELEECVRLSEENGANRKVGTNMGVLAPVIAEKFDLDLVATSDRQEMIRLMQRGAEAVIHVKNNTENGIGLFTRGGHYMVLVSTDGEEACILDPSYTETKFEEEGRKGKVKIEAPFIYCPLDTLMEEVKKDGPAFYVFQRKRNR